MFDSDMIIIYYSLAKIFSSAAIVFLLVGLLWITFKRK